MRKLIIVAPLLLLGAYAFPQAANPEPAGWYAGDIHVHRSCGDSPVSMATIHDLMATQDLSVVSLLADMGNGEVQNQQTDLRLINGQDAAASMPGRTVHWDGEWHWDATYTQYAHQALGGHIVVLGLTKAHPIWAEYTYPVLHWAHQQNGIAGFAHMQYLDGDIPETLNCCIPLEYPVEVALRQADFVSEDVNGGDYATQAYYRLLNTGFRPGLAAGTDYPCNGGAAPGSLLTYAQVPNGQMTYRNWTNAIAKGRTVISRNGHNEFLELKVNNSATPGDEIDLPAPGTVQVQIKWTAKQKLSGTIELVRNGVAVASREASLEPGGNANLTVSVDFPRSGWLAARRMGPDGHTVHTAAVFVTVSHAPVRASAVDAEFYVQWIDNLLTKTSPGGEWSSYLAESRDAAQARYKAAREIFKQIALEASGGTLLPTTRGQTILTTQIPTTFANDSAYELGTKFWADVPGKITAVRLFTSAAEGGDHTVRIWQAKTATTVAGPYTWNIPSGTEGWQTYTLPAPVAITANSDYIIAISNSSDQYYAERTHGFDAPILQGHLHTYALSGVYATTLGSMPTAVWKNTNYFRDVVFVPGN